MKNRNHHFTMKHFNPISTFGKNEPMQKRWQAFAKKMRFGDIGFIEVINSIKNLLQTPFEMVMRNN